MNYKTLFHKVLLEGIDPNGTEFGNPTHDVGTEDNDPIADFLDNGTDSNALDTKGIQDSLQKIESDFEDKMTLLDNIDSLDKQEIDSRLEKVETYLTTLRAFVDSKDEVDMTNPYSIMANIIRSDTVKKTNFDQVTKAIEAYKDASKKEEQATEQAARNVKDTLDSLAKARKSVTGQQEQTEDNQNDFSQP